MVYHYSFGSNYHQQLTIIRKCYLGNIFTQARRGRNGDHTVCSLCCQDIQCIIKQSLYYFSLQGLNDKGKIGYSELCHLYFQVDAVALNISNTKSPQTKPLAIIKCLSFSSIVLMAMWCNCPLYLPKVIDLIFAG